MADLQCAATLLIVRHGEAEYDSPRLEDSGGSLTIRGREQSRELARSLRERNVSIIYASSMARAVQTAEIVAAELGVIVRVRDDLRERSAAESSGQIVERMRAELESAADLHRGETVLFVSHGGAVGVSVPQVARNIPADYPEGRALANCDLVELAVDADGWVVRSWAGEPV